MEQLVIKNTVEIGGVILSLTFDFETQKCTKVVLNIPQHMDGEDLMRWRRQYAKEIKLAKEKPILEYYYSLQVSSQLVDGIDYIKYHEVGLNSRSEADLREALIDALFMTSKKWSKQAIKNLRAKTLDEICKEYNYSVVRTLTPISNSSIDLPW